MMVKSSMMASPMESGARAEVKRGCTETAKAMEARTSPCLTPLLETTVSKSWPSGEKTRRSEGLS